MGTFIAGPAKVWILPTGSDDIQHVRDDVVSYEEDGELRLADSVGTLESVHLEPADEGSEA